MTAKTDYTNEEWAALLRAPLVAGMGISLADPGGPIEAAKETMAAMKSIAAPGSDEELLVTVSQDAMAKSQQRQNPLGDFKLHGATAGQQVLDEMRAVNQILTAKATPDEANAFRQWLMNAAQAAANAAKEGGFMGFGAERVSAGEKQMLNQFASALGYSAP